MTDGFIQDCLNHIRDGAEYAVVETEQTTVAGHSWFHFTAGECHSELLNDLEQLKGRLVAVGPYPPGFDEGADVASAVVADANGTVKIGVY